MAATDPGARLETIRVPALVVTGASDRLIPAALSARLLAIPGARLEVIAGHGHDATSTADYERLVVDFVVTVGTEPDRWRRGRRDGGRHADTPPA